MLYFATVSVAAVDWVASLVPAWYSSTIGLRLGVAQTTAAFAFSIPAAAWLVPAAARGEGTPRDRQDLGNLLLMFVMLWAYIAFTEFLIVWAEDLPREIAWYVPRAQTSWRFLAIALVILEFAVPTFAMLFRAVKRTVGGLTAIAVVVLIGQWLDAAWLIVPSFRPDGLRLRPLDVLATIGVGASGSRWRARA